MIYFDNAATTYPKPKNVWNKTAGSYMKYGFNSGRGGYRQSVETAEKIFLVREKCKNFFDIDDVENISFTQNCTYALNMAIKGIVKKGDHIIISPLEHNAVVRPVKKLFDDGIIEYDIPNFSFNEDELVENFKKLIKANTTLIVCTHASNVFGCVMPIRKIGKLAKENNITFIADCAQSAGIIPVSLKKDNIDVVCAPGHKSLYSLMGVGIMVSKKNNDMKTIIEGGTGSESKNLSMPLSLPDRFEAGTLNNGGILSLGDGIDFINQSGIENLYNKELEMAQLIYTELSKNKNVELYTPFPEKNKYVPMVSFNIFDYSGEKTATILAENDIAVRGGFHCAPLAHQTFKTYDRGVARISIGAFNTYKECEKFLNTVKIL